MKHDDICLNPSASQFMKAELSENHTRPMWNDPTLDHNITQSMERYKNFGKTTSITYSLIVNRNLLNQRMYETSYEKHSVMKKYRRFGSLFSSKSIVEDARYFSLKARNDLKSSTRRGKSIHDVKIKNAFKKKRDTDADFKNSEPKGIKTLTRNKEDEISVKLFNMALSCVGRLLPISCRQYDGKLHFKKPSLHRLMTIPESLPKNGASKRKNDVSVLSPKISKTQNRESWDLQFFIPKLNIPLKYFSEIEAGSNNRSYNIKENDYMEYFVHHSKEENAIHH